MSHAYDYCYTLMFHAHNTYSFPVERLIAIAMNMTMEGTGGDTVCSLLSQASQRPAEQRRVQEEMDAALGPDGTLSWQDRKKLPTLEAFIQELYRTAQAFPTTTLYCNFGKCRSYIGICPSILGF